jgi:hypothetical protein
MLGNISGDVGNFCLPRKVIRVEFVSFLPKTFRRSRNIMMLKTFLHFGDFTLPNNYGTSPRLRKNSFMSKYFEQFRNILMPENFWGVWEFLCCSIILQIMKVKNIY